MNFRDVEMLQNAIQNTGNDALRRRQMAQQHEAEMQRMALEAQMRDMQEKRYDAQAKHFQAMEDIAGQKASATAEAANRPTYKWKSNGVEMTSHDLRDLQNHPADTDEEGKHSITMTGTNENGVTITQTMSIPKTLQGDEETRRLGAQRIADFNNVFGIVPKPQADKTTEFERNLQSLDLDPGIQDLIRKKKAMKEAGVGDEDISALPENQPALEPGKLYGYNKTTPSLTPPTLTPDDLKLVDAPQTSLGAIPPPAATPAAPQGVRVRNKKTGQMGTQLPSGEIIPD